MEKPIHNYLATLEQLYKNQSSALFSNALREHATILVTAFFNHAEDRVIMLSKFLEADFYDQIEVRSAILKAAKRGVSISILTQEKPDSSILLKELQDPEYHTVRINTCSTEHAARHPLNFIVVDGRAFRLEKDYNSVESVASLNNPGIATRLAKVFSELN